MGVDEWVAESSGRALTTAALGLSGGPDSLCLLALLRTDHTLRLRTATVDHALQPSSHASAQRTHKRALAMGVPNAIISPWATPPTTRIEEAARDARYKALWDYMWTDGHSHQTLILAHHADDQLETAIMRALRGTRAYGLGGMRAVRRWGIPPNATAQDALRGMRTWISRPLLNIPKARILATCRALGLEFEQDATNFMPDLTVRNAIRHALAHPARVSPDISHAIAHVHTLAGGHTDPPNIPLMRAYVAQMATRVAQVDKTATHTRPSPPSTLLLVPPPPLDTDTAHALVHRVLRYVSPHPWGSPESQAGRKFTRVQRILERVLDPNPTPTPFAAGAHVLWTPVLIRPDNSIRYTTTGPGCRAWLASRQPPFSSTPLDVEIEPGTALLFWDNRFLIRVPPRLRLAKLVVRPQGRLVLPQVVAKDGDNQHVLDCQVHFIRSLSPI
ncbi:hypothetical protein CTheo_240 [Ceratobasidium theobromae]|uniref:tRNA(Ile)-lysidine synthetase n=1 Tax=Ceratobasidium theobromae TaxID=1582974 RepID=A0A5N5QWZ2_9AGAM|nr:hypothetical protein CTheo_240 [Ceratobasidium theobromae]